MWDRDEKTVARLVYTETRLSPNITAPVLAAYLSLVTGARISQSRTEIGQRSETEEHAKRLHPMWTDIYLSVLESTGQRPGSYTGKLDLPLKASMRSDAGDKNDYASPVGSHESQ